jgi:hypothetical protein
MSLISLYREIIVLQPYLGGFDVSLASIAKERDIYKSIEIVNSLGSWKIVRKH